MTDVGMAEAERIARFGVWKWEIATGAVRWSDELHHIYGVAPGEFEGTVEAFVARLHPDDRERVGATSRAPSRRWSRSPSRSASCARTAASAAAVPGTRDPRPGRRRRGAGRRLPRRHRARAGRAALGASERRMRAIIDNTPSVDRRQGSRRPLPDGERRVRERARRRPADDLIGHLCTELFQPDIADRQRADDRWRPRRASRSRRGRGRSARRRAAHVRDGHVRAAGRDGPAGRDLHDRHRRHRAQSARGASAGSAARLAGPDRLARSTRDGCSSTRSRSSTSATGEPASCELLVRMHERTARSCCRAAFLPAAERFGLIQPIDVWMLRKALELAARARSRSTSRRSRCATRWSATRSWRCSSPAPRRPAGSSSRSPRPRRWSTSTRRARSPTSHGAGLRVCAGRLRHGLRVVHLPARAAAALPEDRPQLRPCAIETTRSCRASSGSRGSSGCRRSPRASRTPRRSTSCATRGPTSRKDSSSAGRRPPASARSTLEGDGERGQGIQRLPPARESGRPCGGGRHRCGVHGARGPSFVANFVTPLIAAIGGQSNFGDLSFTINGSHFRYGLFINALISFVISAAVVYFFVVKPFSTLLERYMPKKEVGPTRSCPECLSDIPAAARRCSFCTSEVGAASA